MPKKAIKVADETNEKKANSVKTTKTVTASAKTTKKVATKSTSKKAIASEKKSTTTKISKEEAPKKTTEKKKVTTSSTKAKKVTEEKTSTAPKAETKKATTKKTSTASKAESKKTTTKKTSTASKVEAKKATTKKASTASKVEAKKATTKKASTVSKAKTEKATPKNTAVTKNKTTSVNSKAPTKIKKVALKTKKVSTASKTNKITAIEKYANVLEYYDLPYRYNETVVKILAQTPKVLFVYWDISDSDREKYSKKYGEFFFNDTYPVLIVHNKTLNYTEEVEINDFANSWYISIPDSRSEYSVELGRRFKEYVHRNPNQPHKEDINNVIPVATSNEIIMPNDHVLLNELKPEIKFRNVKTGEESVKTIKHILADKKLVDFYNLYQKIYQVEDIHTFFNLDNPSSGNPTSTFK